MDITKLVVGACVSLLARGLTAQEPAQPAAAAGAAAAATDAGTVNNGTQWLAWYMALPPDDLQTRINKFAETQDPPPFEWLPEIEVALRDPSPFKRALAAAAIGSHYQVAFASADALRALLEDRVSRVRFTAALALLRVTQNPGESAAAFESMLRCDDVAVRGDAAAALVSCDEDGTRVMEALPNAIRAETDATTRRRLAEITLGWAGRRAARAGLGESPLASFLDDADPVIRANALAGEVQVHRSIDAIEPRVLKILVEGPPDAMVPLLNVLANTKAQLPATIVTRVRVLLLAEDARVRDGALWVLSWIGAGHEWQAPLVAMSDPDEKIRSTAARSLRKNESDGPPDAVLPVLARALGDKSVWVQQEALLAAVSFGEDATPYAEPIARALDIDEGVTQMCAAFFIGTHGTTAPAVLGRLQRMADEPTWSGVDAAWALDSIQGRKGPTEKMRDVLARTNTESTARIVTMEHYFEGSLATLDDGFVGALLDASTDDRAAVRAGATQQLVGVLGLTDDRVRHQLATAASDADAAVRLTAARRLATMTDEEHTDDTRAALDALMHDADAGVSAAAQATTTSS